MVRIHHGPPPSQRFPFLSGVSQKKCVTNQWHAGPDGTCRGLRSTATRMRLRRLSTSSPAARYRRCPRLWLTPRARRGCASGGSQSAGVRRQIPPAVAASRSPAAASRSAARCATARAGGTHDVRTDRPWPAWPPRHHVAPAGLEFFPRDDLQPFDVQHRFGQHLLKPGVFRLERLQALRIRHPMPQNFRRHR